MPRSNYRQTSVNVTAATEEQVAALSVKGYGTFTDIVRIAIDRMAREEGHTMTRVLFQPDMAAAEVVSIIHASQRGTGTDGEAFDFATPQDAAAFVSSFVDTRPARMTGEYTRQAVAAINNGDWSVFS